MDNQKKDINTMFEEIQWNRKTGNDYRFNPQFEKMCEGTSTYIKPRAAKNKRGNFKFIVNNPRGDDELSQHVRVVKCSAAGRACGKGRLAGKVETECKQDYLDVKLAAVNDRKRIEVDTFTFPSSCTCYMKTGYEL